MKEIFTSIRRTPFQSLAAFSLLFFTLFLSILILFSLTFLYGLLGYIETRPQVTVYFRTETSENEIFKIRDELVNSGKVSSIKYISKNNAFKIYKELNKDNPLLLEMVSADILPASLEIYAKKPAYLPEIADFLKNKTGVDEVNFQKLIIDRLVSLTNIMRKTAFAFFGFLIFNAIITLLTIGHFKIALKKDEIELLRFLGASNFYIKKPYLKEGIFFGFVSSLSAFSIFSAILFYFYPFINSYMRGVDNLIVNLGFYQLTVWPVNLIFLTTVFALTTIFGITISTITSLWASQKYIK